MAALLLLACSGGEHVVVDVGPVEEFPHGEVTTVADVGGDTGRWEVLPPGAIRAEPLPVDLLVVRSSDGPGTIEVFLARDPHSGCPVVWQPDHRIEGAEALGWDERGWLVAECSGAVYSRTGERVFGPAPRDLDRLGATIGEDGHLLVDFDTLVLGDDPRLDDAARP